MLYPLVSCLVKGEDEMKITLLQKKRNQLAGYCKLVIYGVFDLVAATDVFKHYSKVEMDRVTNGGISILSLLYQSFMLAVQETFAWKLNIKEDV